MTRLLALALAAAAAHAAEDPADDPHLWLEDVTGEAALGWVRERNAISTAALAADEDFTSLEARMLAIFDSDARIPYVGKGGDHFYNFWRDAAHPRGVWRRTTLESYRTDAPAWEVVLDVDALAAAEGEGWVWSGAFCLEPAWERCLIELSRGGADATVTREFDLASRTFVPDGFQLPEAKGGAGWIDRDTLFVSTDFGDGTMTTSGYPRQVRRWTRGTPLGSASLVFEGQPEDVSVGAWHDPTPGFERDFVHRSVTFYTNELFWLHDGALHKVDKPDDAEARVHREWIFFELRSDWTVGRTTWPRGALLVAPFDAWMKGKRKVEALFTPTERSSLAGYTPLRSHVVLNTLDNVRNRLELLTPGRKGWTRAPLSVPEAGALSVWAVDAARSDAWWLSATDFTVPSSLWLGEGASPPERLKQLPDMFDATGLVVSQHEATSEDGTRVPYFQVARADLPMDGRNPTLLYGYGGFEISLLPAYAPHVGAAWLEQGGVYVVANIRGGGEFGPRWHQAALKEHRHRAYEDFVAVGEDLIARGVTSTPHLGIQGGSNGGLLMGNMLALRPDLWGAVVCKVPLLDMKRFHLLLAGASWTGEYGDPDDPAQWDYIRTFSPYHLVGPDVAYPPLLLMTSTRDDRVHPGHARKLAARLLGWDKDVLYYENIEGGHGGAANNQQQAFMTALSFRFLWDRLRPVGAGGAAPP